MKRPALGVLLSTATLATAVACQPLKVDPERFDFARLDASARDVVEATRAAVRADERLTLHQQAGPVEMPDGVVRTVVVAKTAQSSLLRITIDQGGKGLDKGQSTLVIEGEQAVLREFGDPLLEAIRTRLGG